MTTRYAIEFEVRVVPVGHVDLIGHEKIRIVIPATDHERAARKFAKALEDALRRAGDLVTEVEVL